MIPSLESRVTLLEQRLAAISPWVVMPALNSEPETVAHKAKEFTAAHFRISIADLEGRRRDALTVFPRFVAIHLTRKFTTLSSVQIGAIFNRDHGSILNALQRLAQWMNYEKIADQVATLEKQFARLIGNEPNPGPTPNPEFQCGSAWPDR